MRDTNPGLVTLLFLALAGVFAAPFAAQKGPSSGPVPKTPTPQVTATPAPPPSSGDVAGPLLAEFLPPDERPDVRTTAGAIDALRAREIPVSALIATVPDPADSILDYAFDRSLDALQRAARADRFLLDRYFLPWPEALRPEAPGRAGRPAAHERPPGVLLFRRVVPTRTPGALPSLELLTLFVVGETPIAGLQKRALTRALEETETITRRAFRKDDAPPPLRILGPFFSGSALSLRLTLTEWAARRAGKEPLAVRIVSGSATVSWIKRALEFEDAAARLSTTFSATVLPDRVTRERFFAYLESLGVDFSRVALLTESNTAYGQQPSGSSSPGGASGRAPPEPGLTIAFPMHISQLRAAYERDKLLQPFGAARSAALRPPTLDITLDDPAKRRDAIPSLSDLSTASDEISLAALLATLSRQRIQYAGIVATDVRDKLFLARQISLSCPGVTLFTLDSDILLAHPKYLPYLRGMLVASTYPLYNRNQAWTSDARSRDLFQFPSGGAQGVFNALLVLLGRDDALVEYGPPFPRLVGAGVQDERRLRPPVWLTVVGNTAVWPLGALPDWTDPGGYVHVREAPPEEAGDGRGPLLSTSRVSRLFLWALCLLSVAASALFADRNRRADPSSLVPRISRLRLDGDRRAPYRKDLLLLLLFTPLLIVQVLATSAFLQPYRLALRDGSAPHFSRSVGALLPLAGVLLSLLVLTLTTLRLFMLSIRREGLLFRRRPFRFAHLARLPRLFRPDGDPFLLARLRTTFEAVSGAALILLLLAALALTFYRALPADLLDALLLFERLTNPASGLSILVPLVLLVAACMTLAFCHLRRLTLDETGGFTASLGGRRLSELCGAERIERQIRRTVRQIWVSPALSALLTIVFGLLVAWLLSHLTPTPEREPYQTLFRLAFFFGCLGTLFTAARYLLLWRHLRTFLRLLAAHPMADAFDLVPHRFAEAVGPRAFGRFFALPDFVRLLHLWSLLETEFAAARPGIQRALGLGDDDATRVLTALSKIRLASGLFSGGMRRFGDQLIPAWRVRVRTAETIAFAANVVQRVLEPYWRTKPAVAEESARAKDAPSPAAPPVDRREIDPAAAAWLRRAEEFLAGHIVIWTAYVFLHLRNLLTTFIVSAFLLFLAITAYPFQPARILVFFVFLLVVLLAFITVLTFVQMDRDEILSRVSRTRSGKVSWDFAFVVRLLVYAVLPILSVLGASIPEVQTSLSSVIDSLSRVIK